jgi:16S rRNA (uracil1498-N3)-methyltransferase
MGAEHIYPLLTEHGEKEKFNEERYEKILISSMLQSQQTLLPILHPLQKFTEFLKQTVPHFEGQLFLAHCREGKEKQSYHAVLKKDKKNLILIGPEGDFSPDEIEKSLQSGFIPVHLGNTRLRTETAGIYACAVYNAFQNA